MIQYIRYVLARQNLAIHNKINFTGGKTLETVIHTHGIALVYHALYTDHSRILLYPALDSIGNTRKYGLSVTRRASDARKRSCGADRMDRRQSGTRIHRAEKQKSYIIFNLFKKITFQERNSMIK